MPDTMGQMGNAIRKLLYKNLSLDSYLRVLSGMYLQGYRWGVSPRSEVYEYPRFLKYLVSPGDTAIDIGANLGYYSYVLAGLAGPSGKVYAVEPVRPILNVLRRNLRKYRNVEILNYALGDAEKTIRMGNSSVGENGYFGTGQNFVMDRPTGRRVRGRDAARQRTVRRFAEDRLHKVRYRGIRGRRDPGIAAVDRAAPADRTD